MNLLKLLLSITLVFTVSFLGSYVTLPSIPGWYESLNKPFFNPPNYVFGPIWTILYLMMGISLYMVWNTKTTNKKLKKKALQVFLFQLTLNFLWSVVFFGLKELTLSLFVVISLWMSIFYTIILFREISKSASHLLIPYILWVSFASILNIFIVILN